MPTSPSALSLYLVVLVLGTIFHYSYAWVNRPLRRSYAGRQQPRLNTGLLFATQTSSDGGVLGGVNDFETWFSTLEKSFCIPDIQHGTFGSLRGLRYTGGKNSDARAEQKTTILKIPRSAVLETNYADEDWDMKLAGSLWNECLKGEKSSMYGYCSLLTRGAKVSDKSVPVSTAPNTLRHWTDTQKDTLLGGSVRGRKLLQALEDQEKTWREKHRRLLSDSNLQSMGWEQFKWSMEVVYSRAFRGNFGTSAWRNALSIGAPFVSLVLGYLGRKSVDSFNDMLYFGLVVLAASPLLINLLRPDKGEVVLLPLIDSANHSEEADSAIEFDPANGVFALKVGSKCLVDEPNGGTQLYISYGSKQESELMLDYGFLPGIPCWDGEDEEARDTQRKQLADGYLNNE